MMQCVKRSLSKTLQEKKVNKPKKTLVVTDSDNAIKEKVLLTDSMNDLMDHRLREFKFLMFLLAYVLGDHGNTIRIIA